MIAALRNDGNVAVFASLVSKAVTALTDAPSPPIGPALVAANLPKLELDAMNAEADAPVPLADALVGLLSTLVTSHAGCQCLRDVSLLPVLLPLLKNRNPRHVHIVAHAVHVLEVFIDYTSAAATAFRELGGVELIVDRLKAEAEDALAEHEATHGAAFTAAAAAAAEAGGAGADADLPRLVHASRASQGAHARARGDVVRPPGRAPRRRRRSRKAPRCATR